MTFSVATDVLAAKLSDARGLSLPFTVPRTAQCMGRHRHQPARISSATGTASIGPK